MELAEMSFGSEMIFKIFFSQYSYPESSVSSKILSVVTNISFKHEIKSGKSSKRNYAIKKQFNKLL